MIEELFHTFTRMVVGCGGWQLPGRHSVKGLLSLMQSSSQLCSHGQFEIRGVPDHAYEGAHTLRSLSLPEPEAVWEVCDTPFGIATLELDHAALSSFVGLALGFIKALPLKWCSYTCIKHIARPSQLHMPAKDWAGKWCGLQLCS
jgi:hypothetical protein